jgi:hypothetical protein
MDNQRSADLRKAMVELRLTLSSVSPYDKSANRAERAIRTAKNHMDKGLSFDLLGQRSQTD